MPKQYKITMKALPDAPKSLTPSNLKVTFLPGKSLTTASAAVARYASRRPTTFSVEVMGQKDKAPIPAPVPTPAPVVEVEEEEEEAPEVDQVEAWIELTSEAKNGLPTNDKIKEFAREYEIDLGDATTKDGMIDAIEDYLDVE